MVLGQVSETDEQLNAKMTIDGLFQNLDNTVKGLEKIYFMNDQQMMCMYQKR